MASVTQKKHTPTLVAECIDNSLGQSVATDSKDFGEFELVWAKKFLSLRLDNIKQLRLGNRVNRVYPRGQPGGYAPSLNLAGWLPRGCTDVFCTQNPKKTGYPTVPRKYRVFETHPGRTQRRFTRVKPVLPNPVPKSEVS